MRTIEENSQGRMFSVHHTETSWAIQLKKLCEEQELEEKSEKTKWVDVPKAKYVQRDLEDQIREEQEARKVNNSTNTQIMATITTSGILADLKSGYTRFKKDDKGFGSIEEKYGLTVNEVKELFQTPSLKARKTAEPKRKLEIIDDLAQPQAIGGITVGSVGQFDAGTPAVGVPMEALAVLPDVPQDDMLKSAPAPITDNTKESIFA